MLSRLCRFGLALPRSFAVQPVRFIFSKPKPPSSLEELIRPLNPDEAEEVNPYVKNPDYHGFCEDDPEEDVWRMKVAFFMGISVCLVLGSTFVHYLPDPGMDEWARREAERVVVLREKEGLPLIEPDYYDPSMIILPAPEDQ